LPENTLTDDPVEAGRDDIFLGIKSAIDFVSPRKRWFLRQSWRGTQIFFLADDLLIWHRQESLPPADADWIKTVTEVADGVVCASRTVANQLYQWLAEASPKRPEPRLLGFLHPGTTVESSPAWHQTSRQLLDTTLRNRWYRCWPDTTSLESSIGFQPVIAEDSRLR